MKVDFTKDEIENLREFIEFGFIEYLKTLEQDFDNVQKCVSLKLIIGTTPTMLLNQTRTLFRL